MSDFYLTQMEDQELAKFMATCDNFCISISNVQYSKCVINTSLVRGGCTDHSALQEYTTKKIKLHMNVSV